jgi:hypothetical protein
VAVHGVDQQPEACSNPADGGCFGHRRRTRPIVGEDGDPGAYDHLLEPGDTLTVDHHSIRVLQRDEDGFLVRITDAAPGEDPGSGYPSGGSSSVEHGSMP